jgi:hypothetical protein
VLCALPQVVFLISSIRSNRSDEAVTPQASRQGAHAGMSQAATAGQSDRTEIVGRLNFLVDRNTHGLAGKSPLIAKNKDPANNTLGKNLLRIHEDGA